MVSGKQIKAARALAGMRQDELSELIGLTPQAIRKIEDDSVQPREGTMTDLVNVFTERGIEFIDNQGVRFAPEGVEVLNGQQGLVSFLDEVYNHLSAHGGTISVTDVDEQKWIDVHGANNSTDHFARMNTLIKKRKDVKIRSLAREGSSPPSTSSYTEYRWISRDRFSTVPFYLCGDMLGIIIFQSDPSPKIILIRSKVVADTYRQQFDNLWDIAKEFPPDKGTGNV